MGGRIEAALRPHFRRGPWEDHPERGPQALLLLPGEPQGHLMLGTVSHAGPPQSPTAWPLLVFPPLPQLWGLSHPRQP